MGPMGRQGVRASWHEVPPDVRAAIDAALPPVLPGVGAVVEMPFSSRAQSSVNSVSTCPSLSSTVLK